MPQLPSFIAPTRYAYAADALAQVQLIYGQQITHLRTAMQRYVAGETLPGQGDAQKHTPSRIRACYPFVRIHTETVSRTLQDALDNTLNSAQLSYGFVAGPGRFETSRVMCRCSGAGAAMNSQPVQL